MASGPTVRRLFLRFFAANTGWTLPALFSILRDLRDLAFDVSASCLCLFQLAQTGEKADLEGASNGQEGTANMEEAARIISKAFSNCVTDRYGNGQYLRSSLLMLLNHPECHLSRNRENGVCTMSLG